MSDTSEAKRLEHSAKELKHLRGEILIVLPFLIFALYISLGSFQYVAGARIVPLLIGIITIILTGMRLFHIIFPKSKIGRFKDAGLAGEFDSLKETIAKEALKGKYEEEPAKEITPREERKAIIGLIGSLVAFLFFGNVVGIFFVIVGISYYYGYKEKVPLLISLVLMYLLCYVVLHMLLRTPASFGLLLEPILTSLDLI